MATKSKTITKIGSSPRVSYAVSWATAASGDTGDPLQMPGFSDRSVQISGTFDAGTVVIQGSNDGTNWVTLSDPQGNAISKTSAALEQILEITRYVRFSTSGGGGSMAVDINMLITGGHQYV